jgi:hypothetical protein
MITIWLHGVINDCNMTTCVLNDYKMITYFYFNSKSIWTLQIVVFDMTWHMSCDLIKQVIRHNFNDSNRLIQNDYKSSSKHSFFNFKSYWCKDLPNHEIKHSNVNMRIIQPPPILNRVTLGNIGLKNKFWFV